MTMLCHHRLGNIAVADPDLELRCGKEEGGFGLLALLAFFPSVISSFLPKIRRGAPPPAPLLDPPLHRCVNNLLFGVNIREF